jgi:hypothetical protein
VIRRRAFRGFSRKGFPRKNMCSRSLFDLFLLRYFVTRGGENLSEKVDKNSESRNIPKYTCLQIIYSPPDVIMDSVRFVYLSGK